MDSNEIFGHDRHNKTLPPLKLKKRLKKLAGKNYQNQKNEFLEDDIAVLNNSTKNSSPPTYENVFKLEEKPSIEDEENSPIHDSYSEHPYDSPTDSFHKKDYENNEISYDKYDTYRQADYERHQSKEQYNNEDVNENTPRYAHLPRASSTSYDSLRSTNHACENQGFDNTYEPLAHNRRDLSESEKEFEDDYNLKTTETKRYKSSAQDRRELSESESEFDDNYNSDDESTMNDFFKTTDTTRPTRPDYRELALDLAINGKEKQKVCSKRDCDFVLVYDATNTDPYNVNERKIFEKALKDDDLELIEKRIENHVFVEVYASFDRLCKEAENVCLQMPLEGFLLQRSLHTNNLKDIWRSMKTDNEVDMVSAPFCCASKEIFDGIANEKTFFRTAYRAMLVKHILANIKLNQSDDYDDNYSSKTGLNALIHSGSYTDAFILHERSEYDNKFSLKNSPIKPYNNSVKSTPVDSRKELHDTWLKCLKFQPLWKIRNYYGEKIGLYFAWLGVLITSLWIPVILGFVVFIYGIVNAKPTDTNPRKKELHKTLTSKISYPDNKATTATHVKQWLVNAFDNDATPIFAFLICLWGTVFCEFWKRKNAELAYKWDVDSFEEQEKGTSEDVDVKYQEKGTLQDVDVKNQEPNRPQFYGTKMLKDPITGIYEPYYPLWRKVLKSMGSIGVVLFMVSMVLISVASVIVYKVVSRVDWFSSLGERGEFASSLTASILNSVSILLLGFVYKKLAYILTKWENHRTRTKYDDALIFKLFGFQFVNSYASLFYIAFFRERTSTGVFKLGSNYSDSCGVNNDCMSMLSLQVAVLMVAKPMPKFFTDIVMPVCIRLLKKACCCFTKRGRSNQVDTSERELPRNKMDDHDDYLYEEYRKPNLGNFTLTEYTEKIRQHDDPWKKEKMIQDVNVKVQLFAAAFPLAPLIALITNLIDLRIDARRMLWFNRRPVPRRAQDIGNTFFLENITQENANVLKRAVFLCRPSQIGMWYTILQFLNYTGMITNAFIIGLTSRFGRRYKTETFTYTVPSNYTILDVPYNSSLQTPLSNLTGQVQSSLLIEITSWKNLWIIIIFENAVLAVKFLLAYVIPDVPESVSKAQRQEKIQLEKLLGRSGYKRGPGKTIQKLDNKDTTALDSPKKKKKDELRSTVKSRKQKKKEKSFRDKR